MEYFTMLPAQRNIEMMSLRYPEKEIGNLGGYFRISSEEQTDNVKQILKWMPEVHKALKLTVEAPGVLCLDDQRKIEVPVYEGKEKTEKEIYERIRQWVQIPFEQEKSLCEMCLFHFDNGTWYGCEKFHHIIMDKQSILLLIQWQEKTFLHIQREGFFSVLKSIVPDNRYLQIMKCEDKKTVSEEQAKEWLKGNFSSVTQNWQDHKMTVSARAGNMEFNISEELFFKIRQYAKENQVSAESMWFLVFFTERFKRKGVSSGVIGRMTEYRKRQENDIVGLFSRNLPIPFTVSKKEINLLCRQIDTAFLIALRYGGYSMRQLHSLDPDIFFDFDILVSYHPGRMVLKQDREYREIETGYIDTPLRIWINDSDDRHSLQIFYQCAVYNENEIRNLVRRYVQIMEQIVEGTEWDAIQLLSEKDKKAYELLNKSTPSVLPEKTLVQLFLWRAVEEKNTTHIILKDKNSEWSYRQTVYRFFALCEWLEQKGVKRGDIVGICVERSVWLPVLMLAVLEKGAAFLPIALDENTERKKQLMLTCSFTADMTCFEEEVRNWEEVYTWEELRRMAEQIFLRNPSVSEQKKQRAYLLYTSGSTGEPKAVQISRYSLLCRLQWMYDQYGNGGVTLQKTVNTFDVSIWELLLSPVYGGCLCMLPQGEEKYPDSLAEAAEKWQIRRMHFVPGMLEAFLHYVRQSGKKLPALQEIISSGEALHPETAEAVYQLLPKVRLINLYGPTECTIDVSYHECLPGEQEIPIGRAVANTELYVLSPNEQKMQPIGVAGELCVVGDLVGMGYLDGREGGYFVRQGKQAYRTGDYVSLTENGELLYIGRADRQVKLRGMRIHTGIVEKLLLEKEEISSAYVTVENNCLTAYYEAERELDCPENIVTGKLPDYNVPDQWFHVRKFPKKPNGKTDVKKLAQITRETKAQTGLTKMEESLFKIINQYFSTAGIQLEDSLIDTGLDSFTAIQIIQDIRMLGYDCSYSLIFRYPTVRLLAKALQSDQVKKKGMDFLTCKNQGKLLLCVPYGGGRSEIFGEMAAELKDLAWDIGVVKVEDFQKETVEDIVTQVYPVICRYEKITLLGYCVGSAIVTELAKRLSDAEMEIAHIYLISSLPDTYMHIGKRKISPWAYLSDTQITKQLYRLYSGNFRKTKEAAEVFQGRIPQFRIDSGRFFDYMERNKENGIKIRNTPVTLFFGGKDTLTRRYQKRYKEWERLYETTCSVICYPQAGHYVLDECREEVCEEIRRSM